MADIPNPYNTDFVDWANQLVTSLPDYNIYNPKSITEWREWGTKLINDNNIDASEPTVLFYPEDEDWREWATYFITSVNG